MKKYRYRIEVKETKSIFYEVNAWSIDDASEQTHNWAIYDNYADPDCEIVKIELVGEER